MDEREPQDVSRLDEEEIRYEKVRKLNRGNIDETLDRLAHVDDPSPARDEAEK